MVERMIGEYGEVIPDLLYLKEDCSPPLAMVLSGERIPKVDEFMGCFSKGLPEIEGMNLDAITKFFEGLDSLKLLENIVNPDCLGRESALKEIKRQYKKSHLSGRRYIDVVIGKVDEGESNWCFAKYLRMFSLSDLGVDHSKVPEKYQRVIPESGSIVDSWGFSMCFKPRLLRRARLLEVKSNNQRDQNVVEQHVRWLHSALDSQIIDFEKLRAGNGRLIGILLGITTGASYVLLNKASGGDLSEGLGLLGSVMSRSEDN